MKKIVLTVFTSLLGMLGALHAQVPLLLNFEVSFCEAPLPAHPVQITALDASGDSLTMWTVSTTDEGLFSDTLLVDQVAAKLQLMTMMPNGNLVYEYIYLFATNPYIYVKLEDCDTNTCEGLSLEEIKVDYLSDLTLAFYPAFSNGFGIDSLSEETYFFWQFGDGDQSDEATPVHEYDSAGVYNVCLLVSTEDSCVLEFCRVVWVGEQDSTEDCNAAFVKEPILPMLYQFQAEASYYDFNGEYDYFWDFGDGQTANIPNPMHEFDSIGEYQVCLTVSKGDTCTETFCAKVVVAEVQNPACTAFFWKHEIALKTYQFQAQASLIDSINLLNYTYLWDFGDGNVDTAAAPVHEYENPGLYIVCLKVQGADNCMEEYCVDIWVEGETCDVFFDYYTNDSLGVSFFPYSPDSLAFPGQLEWSFGDGTTSNKKFPFHIYQEPGEYEVCLLSIGETCIDTFCKTIFIEADTSGSGFCNAYFEVIPDGEFGRIFVSSDSIPGYAYFWSFGDGDSSTAIIPYHIYDEPGEYEVCLFVSGPACFAQSCLTITVGDSIADCEVVFDYDQLAANKYEFYIPIDVDLGASQLLWTFGDGDTTSGFQVIHEFEEPGVYGVCLEAFGDQGCYSIYCDSVVVEGDIVDCSADFQILPLPDSINNDSSQTAIYAFKPLSVNDEQELFWFFGDGQISMEVLPVHYFEQPGLYEVCLLVIDLEGNCVDFSCQEVMVGIPADWDCYAGFAYSSTGLSASFERESDLPGIYLWDFGDGAVSDEANPTHTYELPGTYSVCFATLTATGCSDIQCKEIVVGAGSQDSLGIEGGISGSVFVEAGASMELSASMGVFLKDKSGKHLDFTKLDEFGGYSFGELAYGTYTVSLMEGSAEISSLELRIVPHAAEAGNSNFVLGATTSLDQDLLDASLELYPNPVRDRLTLEWDATQVGTTDVQVMDLMGRILLRKSVQIRTNGAQRMTLETDRLPTGAYQLRILGTGQSVTRKIMKY